MLCRNSWLLRVLASLSVSNSIASTVDVLSKYAERLQQQPGEFVLTEQYPIAKAISNNFNME
jgi:hypothetical protein